LLGFERESQLPSQELCKVVVLLKWLRQPTQILKIVDADESQVV